MREADPLNKPIRRGDEMEWLKLLGEGDTFTIEQIEKATAGMKLVDVSEGGYIPREKFNERTARDKAAIEKLEADLDALKAAGTGDDALKSQVSKLEAELKAKESELSEATQRADEATSKATRAEREKLVREKIADPKLSRLALLDAEAMTSDEVPFEDALAKVIAGDSDYQAEPVTKQESGKPTKGTPNASLDPLTAAVLAKVGGPK